MAESITWLAPGDEFPSPELALSEPNGLLAAGGSLDIDSLKRAYYHGIFPWYSEDQPPLWWSPDPRAVLLPGGLHISKSMQRVIRQREYRITTDTAFTSVIQACSTNRRDGTWILPEMLEAYDHLCEQGSAHSVEVWDQHKLVGGLYGVTVGGLFCGESMFHRQTNASKLAFIVTASELFASGFTMIDCQLENPHLTTLGVQSMPRHEFLERLANARDNNIDWPSFEDAANRLC